MKSIPARVICVLSLSLVLSALSTIRVAKTADAAATATNRYVPYRVGEKLEYTVSWSKYLVAATMTAQVKERGTFNEFDSYHVVMQAQTDGLANKIYDASSTYESYVKADGLLPFRASSEIKQPKRLKQRYYWLEPANGKAFLKEGQTMSIPSSTYDVASLFYAVRGINLQPGKPTRFALLENDKLQTLVAEAEGYQQVTTKAGKFDTVRIAIKFADDKALSDTQKVRLYLSKDSRRLPILITSDLTFGSIRVELASIH
jgi:hypothetical protein